MTFRSCFSLRTSCHALQTIMQFSWSLVESDSKMPSVMSRGSCPNMVCTTWLVCQASKWIRCWTIFNPSSSLNACTYSDIESFRDFNHCKQAVVRLEVASVDRIGKFMDSFITWKGCSWAPTSSQSKRTHLSWQHSSNMTMSFSAT